MSANIKNLEERLADLGMGIPHTDQLYMDLRDDEIADLRAALAAATAPQPVAGDIADPVFRDWCGRNGMWAITSERKAFDEAVAIGRTQSARQIATLHAVIGELTAERGVSRVVDSAKALDKWFDPNGCQYGMQAARDSALTLRASIRALAAAPAAPTGSGE
jgi:hypothetical protein